MPESEDIAVAAVVAVAACLLLLIVVLFLRCCSCCCSRLTTERISSCEKSLQTGIAELHRQSIQSQRFEFSRSRRWTSYNNYFQSQREQSSNSNSNPLFNWRDHPSLVSDAVENGWSRFAFIGQYNSSSSFSFNRSILGSCATVVGGDRGRDGRVSEMESAWEITDGSTDFMQKIRLNPELKVKSTIVSNLCVSTTILPLPGPCLGNSSAFPQEAYFEITVLFIGEEDKTIEKRDSEKAKLMDDNLHGKVNSESTVHSTVGSENRNYRESMMMGDGLLAVGLSRGGGYLSSKKKMPGSFPGSIGFNSNGSVYLDGVKHASKSINKLEEGRVIGCGYNPSKKEILFTIDSELIHVIQCKSDEYGSPLYPTLASDINLSLRINLGQSIFSYAPANVNRNPDPCFMGRVSDGGGFDEDSKELFSMGRIDSQWHMRGASRGVDYDVESEGDLFEIVIDANKLGRSPNN